MAERCCGLCVSITVILLHVISVSTDTLQGRRPLSDYITHFEPLFYDNVHLQTTRHRVKRTTTDSQIVFNMHAYGRTFKVRLKRDTSIYTQDIVVENDTNVLPFDSSRTYSGFVEGDNVSSVYGIINNDGLFEGELLTADSDFTIEHSQRYFKDIRPAFHSVIYRQSEIDFDQLNATVCFSDVLHRKLIRRAASKHMPPPRGSVATLTSRGGHERHVLPTDGGTFNRDLIDVAKTTCTMYLQADHLFFQKYDSDIDTVVEQLTQHVQAVNDIYRPIDFDGDGVADDVNFIIKRIKVWTSASAPGYRFSGNYGVEAFLELLSEDNFDAFCLAYMFTYRDFDGGTLGLAWTGDLHNAGGVCEKNGQYRGSLKSLNSGIVTVLNYGKDVPPSVSHVTMAHEIGHNIGSQHDPETPECSPGGIDGNYIMYARATSGDRPNNNKFSSCSKKSMAQVLRLKARGIDGCFIPETSAICGNGVVEGNEECDCGWEDECQEQCCYPQVLSGAVGTPCTRRRGAVCSPSEGPCCSNNCQLIGRNVGRLCREQTSCKTASVCNGSSPLCPASINIPDKTRCDEDSVCFQGECSGSICLAFNLESCQCPAPVSADFNDLQLCQLCCKKPGHMMPCRSAAQWNQDRLFNVPELFAKPGSPCHNFRGYCDVFHKCREVDPTGPLANFKQLFFSAGNVKHWLAVYWYVPSVVAVCLLVCIVITIKFCGLHSTAVKSTTMTTACKQLPSTSRFSPKHNIASSVSVTEHRTASRTTAWPRYSPCRVATVIHNGSTQQHDIYTSWV